ncbi:L-asparaginase [Raphidocelis subcapitata]|uniref:asparaginase n=1 Tax=Raphidocelis subcapitata TaxID=307507 RepID=A0A2V0NXE0_9CHLO|nr:L-asparaginase [Raphidocelis subcapitata]|eukprot:GBF89485.1 L-asparaginase [Raphidocelis subcapitata]
MLGRAGTLLRHGASSLAYLKPTPLAAPAARACRRRAAAVNAAAAGESGRRRTQAKPGGGEEEPAAPKRQPRRTRRATTAAEPAAGAAAADGGSGSGSGSGGDGPSASGRDATTTSTAEATYIAMRRPHVLILHTGGTLGMDVEESFVSEEGLLRLKKGTGGRYKGLKPGDMLSNLLQMVPELGRRAGARFHYIAHIDLKIAFNKDSSRVGPKEQDYDAFLVIHGTDTLAYTASALSLMLLGFKKPIMPLASPRTDARQNLIDALSCAVAGSTPPHVQWGEVAICFGGKLMRGNRASKVDSSSYQAFETPFKLDTNVIRIPIVPGSDPRAMYGDLVGRGVRGVVLEAFGVGNLPDTASHGWLPWLRDQTNKGLKVCLTSQCARGELNPQLYRAGSVAMALGVEAGPQMTSECAVCKLMICLAHPDLPLGVPLAGEL